jgi:translation initiation factor 2B subunit (eIF-2B alpha/beta/delta family)
MKMNDRELLYRLFREHTDVYGTSRLTVLGLESFIESINQLECQKSDIRSQIEDLTDALKKSQPKIVPFIHLVRKFERELEEKNIYSLGSTEEIKKAAVTILEEKIGLFKTTVANLVEKGLETIENGDFIIVHSVSSVVRDILIKAREAGRTFRVLILKQDFIQTRQIIKSLNEAGVDIEVIPDFNLSHYLDDVTKLFLGAISVTIDNKLIATNGSSSIVSLCHVHNVPSYLFVNSLKFSHYKSSDQRIHKMLTVREHDNVTYEIMEHSHDVVDLKQIDNIYIDIGRIEISDIPKFRTSKTPH